MVLQLQSESRASEESSSTFLTLFIFSIRLKILLNVINVKPVSISRATKSAGIGVVGEWWEWTRTIGTN